MKSLNSLMQEIIQLTSKIESDYTELYNYLGETPLSVSEASEKAVSTYDLNKYLDTLKSQLQRYIETHKILVK